MKFNSIQEVINLNESTGRFFFSDGAMKGTGCTYGPLLRGRYFVSSELHPKPGSLNRRVRKYSIRFVTPKGAIQTLYSYGQFYTTKEALKALNNLPEMLPDALDFYEKCWNKEDGRTLQDFYNTCMIEAQNNGPAISGKEGDRYNSFTGSCVYCMMNPGITNLSSLKYSAMRYQFFNTLGWIRCEGSKSQCTVFLSERGILELYPICEVAETGHYYVVSRIPIK